MLPYLSVFGLSIPLYGIMLTLAFLICSFLSWFRARKRGLSGDNLIIIIAFIFGFALLGGGLLYDLITFTPAQIAAFIREGNWEPLFGGIVFYGGAAGGVIGAFVGCKVAKDDIRSYLDVIVPVIPLGHAIGRIGCFCAGCCYGRPTTHAIGVVYTDPVGDAPTGIPLLPVQLFEAGVNILIFIILMVVSGKSYKNREAKGLGNSFARSDETPETNIPDSNLPDAETTSYYRTIPSPYRTTFLYCILYGVSRFILEFFRYDSIRGHIGSLSTSQWVSIALIVCALAVFAVSTFRGRKNA